MWLFLASMTHLHTYKKQLVFLRDLHETDIFALMAGNPSDDTSIGSF